MMPAESYNQKLRDRLAFIQKGRATRRYHGLPMHDYQRIDAHSFGVAALVALLMPNASPERLAPLLLAALYHDLAEHITGDIPAPEKRRWPTALRRQVAAREDWLLAEHGLFFTLDERDKRVLKIADSAEGCLHCIQERGMGNASLGQRAFYSFMSYLTHEQQLDTHPDYREDGETALLTYITTAWQEVNNGRW